MNLTPQPHFPRHSGRLLHPCMTNQRTAEHDVTACDVEVLPNLYQGRFYGAQMQREVFVSLAYQGLTIVPGASSERERQVDDRGANMEASPASRTVLGDQPNSRLALPMASRLCRMSPERGATKMGSRV
jgi:hypothetical protein